MYGNWQQSTRICILICILYTCIFVGNSIHSAAYSYFIEIFEEFQQKFIPHSIFQAIIENACRKMSFNNKMSKIFVDWNSTSISCGCSVHTKTITDRMCLCFTFSAKREIFRWESVHKIANAAHDSVIPTFVENHISKRKIAGNSFFRLGISIN